MAMNNLTVTVGGVDVTDKVNVNNTILLDPSIDVSNGESVSFTYTITDTFTRTSSTGWGATGGGEWWEIDPDMTDWPAADIIDHYAKDLARRRPA
jgi:hypothetical protein